MKIKLNGIAPGINKLWNGFSGTAMTAAQDNENMPKWSGYFVGKGLHYAGACFSIYSICKTLGPNASIENALMIVAGTGVAVLGYRTAEWAKDEFRREKGISHVEKHITNLPAYLLSKTGHYASVYFGSVFLANMVTSGLSLQNIAGMAGMAGFAALFQKASNQTSKLIEYQDIKALEKVR